MKTGVTHYFSIDKAATDIGYLPIKKNLDGVIKFFLDRGHGRKQSRSNCSLLIVLMFVALCVVVIIFSLYFKI